MSFTIVKNNEIQKNLDIDEIVTLYGNELLRMCFLYLKDIHLAEDAVQETFIKVMKKYNQFKMHINRRIFYYL